MPMRCPYFVQGGPECSVGHHHCRQRKTGPRHPLEVARCRVHGKAFTLYPPGHRPYGRQAVVPLASDGSRLLGGEETSADPLEAELGCGMWLQGLVSLKRDFR